MLDVMLPRHDGYARGIRANAETSDTPVILLIARVQTADLALGFDAGADDYPKKPFCPQEFGARVQAVLSRR